MSTENVGVDINGRIPKDNYIKENAWIHYSNDKIMVIQSNREFLHVWRSTMRIVKAVYYHFPHPRGYLTVRGKIKCKECKKSLYYYDDIIICKSCNKIYTQTDLFTCVGVNVTF